MVTQTKHCEEVMFSVESDQPLLCIIMYSVDNGEAVYISFHHPVSTPFGVYQAIDSPKMLSSWLPFPLSKCFKGQATM